MLAPILEPSSELRWVLVRSFAEPDHSFARGISPARAVELAKHLDLAARIATRVDHEQLVEELGELEARKLQLLKLRVVALNQALARTTTLLVDLSAELGIKLVLLKHSALRAANLTLEGTRDARDVDVLVDAEDGKRLQQQLRELGFRPYSAAGAPHHFPSLARGPGEVVEVHHRLFGVSLDDASHESGQASLLISKGLARFHGGAYVPVASLLAAHALVHALVQHRSAPAEYPMLRVIADLCDVGAHVLHDPLCRELAAGLGESEFTAARALVVSLLSGTEPQDLGEGSGSFRLLSHLVGASVDADYQHALRLDWHLALRPFSALVNRLAPLLRGLISLEKSTATPTFETGTSPATDAMAEALRLASLITSGCVGYARTTVRHRRLRV